MHNRAELNRELSEFLNEIILRENVEIGYHKDGTTPQLVVNLAWNACPDFSKQVASVVQPLCVFPLITPIAAIYECAESAFNGTLD